MQDTPLKKKKKKSYAELIGCLYGAKPPLQLQLAFGRRN